MLALQQKRIATATLFYSSLIKLLPPENTGVSPHLIEKNFFIVFPQGYQLQINSQLFF
jgi:hypothetical protein